jgi:hypothetical protein
MEIPRQHFSNGVAHGELCKIAPRTDYMFPKNDSSVAPGTPSAAPPPLWSELALVIGASTVPLHLINKAPAAPLRIVDEAPAPKQ